MVLYSPIDEPSADPVIETIVQRWRENPIRPIDEFFTPDQYKRACEHRLLPSAGAELLWLCQWVILAGLHRLSHWARASRCHPH